MVVVVMKKQRSISLFGEEMNNINNFKNIGRTLKRKIERKIN